MKEIEEWKEVEGYKYLYISNLGRVKRIGHNNKGIRYKTEYIEPTTEIYDSDTERFVKIEPRIKFYEEETRYGSYVRYGGNRSLDYKVLMKKYWDK